MRTELVWGDNKLVMAPLLQEFNGKVDLIYIDPPFDVGADLTMNLPIGEIACVKVVDTFGYDTSITIEVEV
jgi:16S rRNA G966 N2-methylase RsmD